MRARRVRKTSGKQTVQTDPQTYTGEVHQTEDISSGDSEQNVATSGETQVTEDAARKGAKKKKRPKLTLKQRVVRLLMRIVVLAAVIWLLVTVVGGVFICHTNDMYPAVRDGDLLITFRLGTYRSTDIVVYEHEGQNCYGRIVGEPSDVIELDEDGTYTVNGTRPYETIFYETKLRDSDTMTFPYTIQQGEYFVLADDREGGVDSRNLGPVTKLKGKVVLQLRRRGF